MASSFMYSPSPGGLGQTTGRAVRHLARGAKYLLSMELAPSPLCRARGPQRKVEMQKWRLTHARCPWGQEVSGLDWPCRAEIGSSPYPMAPPLVACIRNRFESFELDAYLTTRILS